MHPPQSASKGGWRASASTYQVPRIPSEGVLTNAVSIEGQYANYLRIGSNAVEFVLDFGQQVAGDSSPEIVIRVFTTPTLAKEFLRVLQESVDSYEAVHGPIRSREGSDDGS
jgi:hypothetical protein